MKTSALHIHELAESVLAVPPLARQADLSIAEAPNRRLIKHIEAGGIRTLLYGGNANLYHMPLREYPAMLDMLADAAGPQTRVIPSVGPDFGKMIEQAPMLRDSGYQTAMVLPMQGLSTSEGVAEGIARFVDIAGIPVTLYIKSEQYIDLDRLERLVADGLVLCVKYAIPRSDPDTDPFLQAMLERISAQRVVSGMGERPVLSHVGRFGMASFTTGSGCIAPNSCSALLRALQGSDMASAQPLHARFLPLETLRDSVSLIRVLHDAVSLCGIADMGPQLPLLSASPAEMTGEIEATARRLLASETAA